MRGELVNAKPLHGERATYLRMQRYFRQVAASVSERRIVVGRALAALQITNVARQARYLYHTATGRIRFRRDVDHTLTTRRSSLRLIKSAVLH